MDVNGAMVSGDFNSFFDLLEAALLLCNDNWFGGGSTDYGPNG